MKKIGILSIIVASFLFVLYTVSESGTYNGIRCGSSIVDVGMPRYEVVAKCGQPQDIMRRSLEIITHNRVVPSQKSLHDGGVYDYFVSNGSNEWNSCDNHDRMLKMYFEYYNSKKFPDDGQGPVTRHIIMPSYTLDGDAYHWQCVKKTVDIETYIYNPGAKNFLRYFTFENGILKKIETGNYGF